MVDGGGNIYIVDSLSNTVTLEALETDGSYVQTRLFPSAWSYPKYPGSIAVDGSGNLYIADEAMDSSSGTTPGVVYKETLKTDGSYTQTAIGSGWNSPSAIAVDGEGNVYVADGGSNAVYKETPSGTGYTQSTVADGLFDPTALAVDKYGNLYIGSNGYSTIYKLDLDDAPALSFAKTVVGTTSSDSPQTVTVNNYGNTPLKFSAVSYPTDFPQSSTQTGGCSASTTLAKTAGCKLTINFTPVTALGQGISSGVLNESVSVTTNTLNVSGTQSTIAVTGTETKLTPGIVMTASSNPTPAATATGFTATVKGAELHLPGA